MTSTPDWTEVCAIDALLPDEALPRAPCRPQQHRQAVQHASSVPRVSPKLAQRRPQPQFSAEPFYASSAAMPVKGRTCSTSQKQQQEKCFSAAMARLQQQQKQKDKQAAGAGATTQPAFTSHRPKQPQQHADPATQPGAMQQQQKQQQPQQQQQQQPPQVAMDSVPGPAQRVSKHQLKKAGRQARKKGGAHMTKRSTAQGRNRAAHLAAR